jgi:hypothetical protein
MNTSISFSDGTLRSLLVNLPILCAAFEELGADTHTSVATSAFEGKANLATDLSLRAQD